MRMLYVLIILIFFSAFSINTYATTIKLQASGTENLADTYVRKDAATTNYGTALDLYMRDSTTTARHIYIKFNTSSLPAGATINSAMLYVEVSTAPPSDTNVSVYHVNDTTWNGTTETTITWNNQPCGLTFNNATKCNLTADDWHVMRAVYSEVDDWNVTNSVKRSYNNGDKNVSFALKSPETGSQSASGDYESREYTGALIPWLNITYTVGGGTQYNLTGNESATLTFGSTRTLTANRGGTSTITFSESTSATKPSTGVQYNQTGSESISLTASASAIKTSAGINNNISQCFVFNQNNTLYQLNTSFTNTTATKCMDFSGNVFNDTLDCQGYNINGSRSASSYGIYISSLTNVNDTIKNCNITNWYYGMDIISSSNLTIQNDTITSSASHGISITSSSNFIMKNNTVNSNIGYGVYVGSDTASVIDNNTVVKNTNDGIVLESSSTINVTNNNITTDDTDFICDYSSNNQIINNILADANVNGFYGTFCSGNTISNNIIINNNRGNYGLAFTSSSNNNTLTNNSIYNSALDNILITSSSNNTIVNGTINNAFNQYDYDLSAIGKSNNFTNTNFTASRSINLGSTTDWFNYANDTSGLWLGTNNINGNKLIRTLNSWSQTNMNWSESDSSTDTANYTLTGLLANTQYNVYNFSTLVYQLTTDANGALNFTIALNTTIRNIQVTSVSAGATYNGSGALSFSFSNSDYRKLNASRTDSLSMSFSPVEYRTANLTRTTSLTMTLTDAATAVKTLAGILYNRSASLAMILSSSANRQAILNRLDSLSLAFSSGGLRNAILNRLSTLTTTFSVLSYMTKTAGGMIYQRVANLSMTLTSSTYRQAILNRLDSLLITLIGGRSIYSPVSYDICSILQQIEDSPFYICVKTDGTWRILIKGV